MNYEEIEKLIERAEKALNVGASKKELEKLVADFCALTGAWLTIIIQNTLEGE